MQDNIFVPISHTRVDMTNLQHLLLSHRWEVTLKEYVRDEPCDHSGQIQMTSEVALVAFLQALLESGNLPNAGLLHLDGS